MSYRTSNVCSKLRKRETFKQIACIADCTQKNNFFLTRTQKNELEYVILLRYDRRLNSNVSPKYPSTGSDGRALFRRPQVGLLRAQTAERNICCRKLPFL